EELLEVDRRGGERCGVVRVEREERTAEEGLGMIPLVAESEGVGTLGGPRVSETAVQRAQRGIDARIARRGLLGLLQALAGTLEVSELHLDDALGEVQEGAGLPLLVERLLLGLEDGESLAPLPRVGSEQRLGGIGEAAVLV